jgi:hypothetical protein
MGTDEEMIRCIEIYNDENGSDESNLYSDSDLQFFEKNKLNAQDWDHVCPHCHRKMDFYFLKRKPRELELDRLGPVEEEGSEDIPLEPEALAEEEAPSEELEVKEVVKVKAPMVFELAEMEKEEEPGEGLADALPEDEPAEEEQPEEEPKPKKKKKVKKVRKKKAKPEEEPESEEEPEPEEEPESEEEPEPEEEPESEEGSEEDQDDWAGSAGDDDPYGLDDMERKELKAFIKYRDLDIKVKKVYTDDDLRDMIRSAMEEEDYGEGDDEE